MNTPEPLEFDFGNDQNADHNPQPYLSRWVGFFTCVGAALVLICWAANTPPGALGKADAIAYAICHRIADRTFPIDANTLMPLCARCTGIYLGAMVGLAFAVATKRTKVTRRPDWKISVVLLFFIGVMGIDGLNSYIHLFGMSGVYEPHNWLRLVTGMLCGVAVFQYVFPAFNSVVWRSPDRSTRIVKNWAELGALLVMSAFMILITLTDRPVFMWVLSFLSIAGVLVMLTMIGTVIFVSLLRVEAKARRWSDLAVPLLAGLTIAFIEIGGMDILRFALTRTWDGFKFGL
jgi:uncharacterized membrane protein